MEAYQGRGRFSTRAIQQSQTLSACIITHVTYANLQPGHKVSQNSWGSLSPPK